MWFTAIKVEPYPCACSLGNWLFRVGSVSFRRYHIRKMKENRRQRGRRCVRSSASWRASTTTRPRWRVCFLNYCMVRLSICGWGDFLRVHKGLVFLSMRCAPFGNNLTHLVTHSLYFVYFRSSGFLVGYLSLSCSLACWNNWHLMFSSLKAFDTHHWSNCIETFQARKQRTVLGANVCFSRRNHYACSRFMSIQSVIATIVELSFPYRSNMFDWVCIILPWYEHTAISVRHGSRSAFPLSAISILSCHVINVRSLMFQNRNPRYSLVYTSSPQMHS